MEPEKFRSYPGFSENKPLVKAPENPGLLSQLSIGPGTFAIALIANAVFAAVLAVLLTLSVVRDGASPKVVAQLGAASAGASVDRDAPAPRISKAAESTAARSPQTSPLAVKPAAGAPSRAPGGESVSGFTIPETVEITLGKPSSVPFRLEPANARLEPLLVVFEGLPPGTGVYGLTRLGENSWRLHASLSHVMLMLVPPDAANEFSMRMRLQRDDGSLVALRTVRMVAKP